jgi:hypothetical protein
MHAQNPCTHQPDAANAGGGGGGGGGGGVGSGSGPCKQNAHGAWKAAQVWADARTSVQAAGSSFAAALVVSPISAALRKVAHCSARTGCRLQQSGRAPQCMARAPHTQAHAHTYTHTHTHSAGAAGARAGHGHVDDERAHFGVAVVRPARDEHDCHGAVARRAVVGRHLAVGGPQHAVDHVVVAGRRVAVQVCGVRCCCWRGCKCAACVSVCVFWGGGGRWQQQ